MTEAPDNLKVFPLADKPPEVTTPREALIEAIRMIDSGESEANGVVVLLVKDVREDDGNVTWSMSFVMGGEPVQTLTRTIGWLEVAKSMFMKALFGEEL